MHGGALLPRFAFASPRLRGEAGAIVRCATGEGALRESECAERAPHPNPLREERGEGVLPVLRGYKIKLKVT